MWSRAVDQKSSSWLSFSSPDSEHSSAKNKIMSNLSMEGATIRASLKMLLILITFAFLSSACSCSTANLIKEVGHPDTDVSKAPQQARELVHKVTVRDKLLGVFHFLMRRKSSKKES